MKRRVILEGREWALLKVEGQSLEVWLKWMMLMKV